MTTIDSWEFLIVGIFIMHLKTFYELLANKTLLSENEEKAFEMIRIAKEKGQITEWEAKNLYIKLCEQVLANVELKQATKEEISRSLE